MVIYLQEYLSENRLFMLIKLQADESRSDSFRVYAAGQPWEIWMESDRFIIANMNMKNQKNSGACVA